MKRSTTLALGVAVLAVVALLAFLLLQPSSQASAADPYRTHATPGGGDDCTLVDAVGSVGAVGTVGPIGTVGAVDAADAVVGTASLPGEVDRLREGVCRTVGDLPASPLSTDQQLGGALLGPVVG